MTFLEQLQESAGLLNNQISNTDTTQIKNLFGNYNPNAASDYVFGPMGGIAQNRFDANQFQLPYQPGEFTAFGGQFGSGGFNQNTGFNTSYTPGSYTPGAFNETYGNMATLPSTVSTTTMQDRGSNESDRRQLERSQGRYSYETFNGKSYRVNNFTGEVEEADLPFGTASLLGGLINQIPGVADYRFENLPLNTQEQINNLVANDPNSLRNAQGINDAVKKTFGVDLNSNLTNEYNQAQGLTTPAGLLNRPVNLNITPQDLSLLGGIPTAPTTATERLNITEAEKIAANQRLAQAKALQDQQNARDLQKQAEKERQAREKRNATPAKVDANKARQLRDRNMGKGTDRSGTGNYGGGYQGGR